jgi:hypothetical protein
MASVPLYPKSNVTPALVPAWGKAGVQTGALNEIAGIWIPACAGMTDLDA